MFKSNVASRRRFGWAARNRSVSELESSKIHSAEDFCMPRSWIPIQIKSWLSSLRQLIARPWLMEQQLQVPMKVVDALACDRRPVLRLGQNERPLDCRLHVKRQALRRPVRRHPAQPDRLFN